MEILCTVCNLAPAGTQLHTRHARTVHLPLRLHSPPPRQGDYELRFINPGSSEIQVTLAWRVGDSPDSDSAVLDSREQPHGQLDEELVVMAGRVHAELDLSIGAQEHLSKRNSRGYVSMCGGAGLASQCSRSHSSTPRCCLPIPCRSSNNYKHPYPSPEYPGRLGGHWLCGAADLVLAQPEPWRQQAAQPRCCCITAWL